MLFDLLSFRKPRLPYRLYEASPFLYIALGMLVHHKLGGVLATFSGSLLILAGVRALYLRWLYRSAQGSQGDYEAALVATVWDQSRLCEHEIIDAEHRALFSSAHTLLEAAVDSHPDLVNRLISELIRKLETHFRSEEGILQRANPAIAAAHREEHGALSAKIHALHRGYLAGKVRRHELIDFIVIEALGQHTKDDRAVIDQAFWG